jgi:hypothetical protein
LSLGGSPNTALLRAVSITLGWTGTLAIARGGTGANITATQYGLPYFASTTAMASTGAGTNTQVLHGNAAGAPTWSAVALGTDVSGLLPLANGGTNTNTSLGAQGGVAYKTATGIDITLVGTSGQVLQSNGTAAPSWVTPSSGSATAGSVIFAGASGSYSQDNSNFFYDYTNLRLGLGLGTIAPLSTLFVKGVVGTFANFGNLDARPAVGTSRIQGEISAFGCSQGAVGPFIPTAAANEGFMRLSAGGGTSAANKSFIDLSGYSQIPELTNSILMGIGGSPLVRISSGIVNIGTDVGIYTGTYASYGPPKLIVAGGYSYFLGSGTQVPLAGDNALVISNNYSNVSKEVNFWNTANNPSVAFNFRVWNSVPTYQSLLNIASNTTLSSQLVLPNSNVSMSDGRVYGDTSYGLRLDTVGNTSAIRIDGSLCTFGSSVGVNTVNPRKKLDVLDTAAAQVRLTYTDNSVYTDLQTNSTGDLLIQPSGGSIVPGTGALTTSATQGFVYLPSCAGAPTGVPTAYTGRAPTVIDSSNCRINYYNPVMSTWMGDLGCSIRSERLVIATANSTFYSFNIPDNTTLLQIRAKCWGGGGAFSGLAGGCGGYGESTLTTANMNISQVYMVVGYGGAVNNTAVLGTYMRGSPSGSSGGGGGGASFVAVWNGTTMSVVSIGGGGGSGSLNGTGPGGGASNVVNASAGTSGSNGTGGAAGSTAGAGTNAAVTATGGGVATTALANLGGIGGTAGSSGLLLAGGGGGYGGGGGSSGSYPSGSGDNYGTVKAAGSSANPGNNADVDYYPNAGKTGSSNPTPGTAGCLVVYLTLKQTIDNLFNYKVWVSTARAISITINTDSVLSFDSYLDGQFANSTYKFYDPMSFHSINTNLTRFTVPTGGAGTYRVQFMFRPTDGAGNCVGSILKNGSIMSNFAGGRDGSNRGGCYNVWFGTASVADYFEFTANASVSPLLYCSVSIERIN